MIKQHDCGVSQQRIMCNICDVKSVTQYTAFALNISDAPHIGLPDCLTLSGKKWNMHQSWFSSVTVKTLDFTMQWTYTNMEWKDLSPHGWEHFSARTNNWNFIYQSTWFYNNKRTPVQISIYSLILTEIWDGLCSGEIISI